jgi:hypothetical protein
MQPFNAVQRASIVYVNRATPNVLIALKQTNVLLLL